MAGEGQVFFDVHVGAGRGGADFVDGAPSPTKPFAREAKVHVVGLSVVVAPQTIIEGSPNIHVPRRLVLRCSGSCTTIECCTVGLLQSRSWLVVRRVLPPA